MMAVYDGPGSLRDTAMLLAACSTGARCIKYRTGRGCAMSCHRQLRGAVRDLFAWSFVCLAGASLLPGCTELKRSIGLEKTSPDEFAVESRAPLEMPPDFDLRPPQPGASRPQEKSSDKQAKQLIETAGPG